jgi:hypothetical protein
MPSQVPVLRVSLRQAYGYDHQSERLTWFTSPVERALDKPTYYHAAAETIRIPPQGSASAISAAARATSLLTAEAMPVCFAGTAAVRTTRSVLPGMLAAGRGAL